jgi:hypothetical protein
MPKEDPVYVRLSHWSAYQRHQCKSLRKEQIELLQSINYTTTPGHRETDEYNRLKQLHKERGGIKIPVQEHDLATCLSRQKKLFNSDVLDTSRKEKLLKIGVCPSNEHT